MNNTENNYIYEINYKTKYGKGRIRLTEKFFEKKVPQKVLKELSKLNTI